MSTVARLAVLLSFTCAVFFFVILGLPLVGGSACLCGGILDDCQTYWQELVRGEAITERDTAVQRSLLAKQQVISELADGSLTLVDAVERFRDLEEGFDDGQDDILGTYPRTRDNTLTLEDQIFQWVRVQMRDDPRLDTTLARLTRELALLQHGTRLD